MSEPLQISVHVEEKRYQPTQEKTVVPDWDAKTVTPDKGYALSKVTVEGMPEPTESETFTENGTYDVGRIGTAVVDVEVNLQDKTVTPTKQTQTIEADAGYDGLDTVTVNPIPPEYVVPSGSVEITANGQVSVAGKATANVSVPQGVFPAGTKLITQNVTGVDVTNYAAVDVAVPEYDDGGWGREVGAPNLDLLRLPGRECASGSGNHVIFLSYYQAGVMSINQFPRLNSGVSSIVNIKDVTVNVDGSYTENETITVDYFGSFQNFVNSDGWHVLRIELTENNSTIISFYSEPYPITAKIYEVIECGVNSILPIGSHQASITLIDSAMTNTQRTVFANKALRNVEFDNFDTSNVTTMEGMFSDCVNLMELDLSSFNTANVTTMKNMFNRCTNLRYLDLSSFDTSNVTTMEGMFSDCVNLMELDLSSFNTANVTNITSTKLTLLQTITFSDNQRHQFPIHGESVHTWIADPNTAITSMQSLISDTSYVTNVINFPIIHTSFVFTKAYLTLESLLTILNALPEVETSQTVTIGATNIAKLTADQIAIAQDKGWTVT